MVVFGLYYRRAQTIANQPWNDCWNFSSWALLAMYQFHRFSLWQRKVARESKSISLFSSRCYSIFHIHFFSCSLHWFYNEFCHFAKSDLITHRHKAESCRVTYVRWRLNCHWNKKWNAGKKSSSTTTSDELRKFPFKVIDISPECTVFETGPTRARRDNLIDLYA